MGRFLNPDNSAFQIMLNSKIYVDKTGLPDAMSLITEKTGNKFIVIIDEWDVLIRDEAMNQKIQDEYIGYAEEVRELCDLWSWLY